MPSGTYFTNKRDQKIYYEFQLAESEKFPIVFSHGLGEHIGRYRHVFDFFCKAGFSCYGFDHQGHGKSYGKKGHVTDFENYRSDLDSFIDFVQVEQKVDQVYLIAHSMGALIALGYAIRNASKIKSLVVSSPGLMPRIPVPKIKDMVGRLFGKLIPKLTQANGLDLNGLAKNPQVQIDYLADPLVHDRASASWYLAWMNETEFVQTHCNIDIPTLIMTGLDDGIIDPQSIVSFYDQLNCPKKELKQYSELRHELFNEKENQMVFNEIVDFLNLD